MLPVLCSMRGRIYELILLRQSGWKEIMEQNLTINLKEFYIFSNCAYRLRPYIIRSLFGDLARAERMELNTFMSSFRVPGKQNCNDLKPLWTKQDFARNLKNRQAPIGLLYSVSTILQNITVIIYKCGKTAHRRGVEPRTLEV